jgi:hypothetical protein
MTSIMSPSTAQPPTPSKCTSARLATGTNIVQNPSFDETLFPWKIARSGNWDHINVTADPSEARSFYADFLGSGTAVLFLSQDGLTLPPDTVQIKCSIFVRASIQACPCETASVGFQVIVGGVPCVGFRMCNEVDYVKDATVDFTPSGGNAGVELIIDTMGKDTEWGIVWVDDVVIRPVYRECVGWA